MNITPSTVLDYVLNDPTLQWIAALILLLAIVSWLAFYLFESYDRNRVIEAAKQWAENKERRNQRAENKKLWDSVEQLKRGQRAQRNDYRSRHSDDREQPNTIGE